MIVAGFFMLQYLIDAPDYLPLLKTNESIYTVYMALNKNVTSIIFLLFFAAILMGFYSIMFRTQNDISEAELRTLQKIPSFSLEAFTEGTYQSEMDQAVSDQFLFSAEIKQLVKDFDNSIVSLTSNIAGKSVTKTLTLTDSPVVEEKITEPVVTEVIEAETPVGENIGESISDTAVEEVIPEPIVEPSKTVQIEKYPYIYTEVIDKYIYKLDDSGYIIQKACDPNTYDFDIYDPEMLKKVTYPKYLYFINSSMSVDFREPHKYDPLSVIKQNIEMDGYDELKFDNFEEYKKYFYQTDHHWNYRGSYEGYKQCIRMLEGEDVKILEPTRTHTYHTIYNGSLARDNALKCSTEEFTVYEFDIPPYKTYINDEEAVYGYRYLYVSDDDYPHNTYSNHYGMYYGDDHAKVVYVFDNPDAESLLILGTSYSNAVNELIASHYKETHVLDFRHYRKQYGKAIDAQSYMEENNLDKLLIIGDISSIGHKVR
jgi:hypothetical protein